VRPVRLSGGAARLRAGDRHDAAQTDGRREGRVRSRGDGAPARRHRGGRAGTGVARLRGLGLRRSGRRGAARARRRQSLRAGADQAAILPARRNAVRRGPPPGRGRERGEPHHARLSSRPTGVPQEMMASLRAPGAILLVSCYELGHQPLGLAWPLAFLERAGYAPRALDLALEPLDEAAAARAHLVAIMAPMHTALRLGVPAAQRIRGLNPSCQIVFCGLYALLCAEFLLDGVADDVMGGEFEGELVALAQRLEAGREPQRPGAALQRLAFPLPSRASLPPLTRYVRLARDDRLIPAGYVEASRGCLHTCLHCPIPPGYGGRFFAVPRAVVLEDIRGLVAAGGGHITFCEPDFLNGPGHPLKLVRELHAAFPDVSYDFTAKIEHVLRHRELFPEFAATGCAFVVSAVEALSDVVLTNLEKGHTKADVAAAITILRRTG